MEQKRPSETLRELIENWPNLRARPNVTDDRHGIEVTDKRWQKLLEKLDRPLRKSKSQAKPECYDEELWTFLTAAAYAAEGEAGTRALVNRLAGDPTPALHASKIWLEYLPLPPRSGEGNTNLDLAAGAISRRRTTKGGIAYSHDPSKDDAVVFCEMKWYSDLSKDVTGDPHRNQLIRVIENAVTFQDAKGKRPERVYVTLVTPAVFRDRLMMSRLYTYKFAEYSAGNGPTVMKAELDACRLKRYAANGWKYPKPDELERRVKSLKLNWLTYEELIGSAPENPVAAAVRDFEKQFNRTEAPAVSTEENAI